MAFAHAGVDPLNRLRTFRGLIIKDQPEGVTDLVPLHVSGGVPIQVYLRDLMERLSNPGSEHALSEDLISISSRSSASSSEEDLNSSSFVSRDAVIDELLSWFSRHQPIRVRLPQLDQSVYMWRSFLNGEVDNHMPPPADRVAKVSFFYFLGFYC